MSTGPTRSILNELFELAQSRTPASWESRFIAWEKPASDTEEDEIEYAGAEVSNAIMADPWFKAEGVEIRPQGSYHNNTNVRLEADMDLCAWHPGIATLTDVSIQRSSVYAALDLRDTGQSNLVIAADLRAKIVRAMVKAFGNKNVDSTGTKAVTVSNIPGSRAPVDVVPALKMFWVRSPRNLLESAQGPYVTQEGVIIYGSDGSRTLNFPRQHYDNAVAKRAATSHRFKRMVRIFKRMRDELVEMGRLKRGQAPSFLIESLVYAVEDWRFLVDENRFDRVKRLLARMAEQLTDSKLVLAAYEINGIKPLFDAAWPWHQKWTPADGFAFVEAAWNRLHN